MIWFVVRSIKVRLRTQLRETVDVMPLIFAK